MIELAVDHKRLHFFGLAAGLTLGIANDTPA